MRIKQDALLSFTLRGSFVSVKCKDITKLWQRCVFSASKFIRTLGIVGLIYRREERDVRTVSRVLQLGILASSGFRVHLYRPQL